MFFGVNFGNTSLCFLRWWRMDWMPSSWGMLVYNEETSAVTNMELCGRMGKELRI